VYELYQHTDRLGGVARVLFVDFSSAFNTIQPHILLQKLIDLNINSNIIAWIKSFLTHRLQFVKFKDSLSDTIEVNTGSPQGCVLSALLFTLYTYDCQSCKDNCILIKYADDTVIAGFVNKNRDIDGCNDYFDQIECFNKWCKTNFLDLNVRKTKELIVDFGRTRYYGPPVAICDEQVEVVSSYKYLGTLVDDRLDFVANSVRVCKRAGQRLYFLRKLKYLEVDNKILTMFHTAVIQSVLTFCVTSWFGNLKQKDKKVVERIQRNAVKLGCINLQTVEAIYDDVMRKKTEDIMTNEGHPLSDCYQWLPSGLRLRPVNCRTNRLLMSFVPASIRRFNNESRRCQSHVNSQ
jgi:hypothetical protein